MVLENSSAVGPQGIVLRIEAPLTLRTCIVPGNRDSVEF